jgi:hypothetical protein
VQGWARVGRMVGVGRGWKANLEVGRVVTGGHGWAEYLRLANVCRDVQRYARCPCKGRQGCVNQPVRCRDGQLWAGVLRMVRGGQW